MSIGPDMSYCGDTRIIYIESRKTHTSKNLIPRSGFEGFFSPWAIVSGCDNIVESWKFFLMFVDEESYLVIPALSLPHGCPGNTHLGDEELVWRTGSDIDDDMHIPGSVARILIKSR